MKRLKLAAALVPALALAACGSHTPPVHDTTPPSIVSITPANLATGVAKDANIVIVFSEKMNQAVTQAAYQSADLPAAAVTFSWNAGGTELTINPNADLEYTGAGKTYAFSLTSTATDLAGNPLAPVNSSFRTFRQINVILESTAALDGWVRSDGTVDTASNELRVGDSTAVDNATYRSYLSFDLSALPAELQSANVLSAVLKVHQYDVTGAPYTDLDVGSSDLILEHVNYGSSLTQTDFDPTVYANLGDLSSSSAPGDKTRPVLSALKNDLENNRTRSQYRLRFAALTDGDGLADLARIYSGNNAANKPTLGITYLIP
ncbi:MAG: Ig-like domain-containing protein [Meiothermus sp.]|nr:Ig-like domain-containing protein [Meiothermus sp.]